MLRSRLISEGVRTVYPSIVQGVYTPEEIEAIPPEIPATIEAQDRKLRPAGDGAVRRRRAHAVDQRRAGS
jgi:hypothetical protein